MARYKPKHKGKLVWKGTEFIVKVMDELTDAANLAAADLAKGAIRRAPYGTHPTTRRKTERVVARHPRDFTNREERHKQVELIGLTRTKQIGALRQAAEKNPKVLRTEAKRFRVVGTKESPAVLVFKNGTIKGIRRNRQHLRDTIHALPAERISRDRVRARVVATAKHAAAIEFGFHHKPDGKFVKGRSYMRRALEEDVREPWTKGSYLRKG